MRNLKLALVVLCSLALISCEEMAGLLTPTPSAPPQPATIETAVSPPTPGLPSTPTPMPSPAPAAGVVGPLMAGGYQVEALVMPPGSNVRYVRLPGRLARSDDGGANWLQVTDLELPHLLVSPHGPRTLYAGDMAPCYAEGPAPVFRRSCDGGESWQELPGGLGIRPVAEHPARAGTLYGISCLGLHLSADAGETWQTSGPTDGLDITSVLPLAGEPLRLLAVLTSEGGSSQLAWFGDAGERVEGTGEGLSFWGLGALAQAGDALYVANSTGVWRSEDGGGQWVQCKDGLADVVLAADPLVAGVSEEDAGRGFGLLALAADPARPERLALGTVRGLYLSEDRGEHWLPAAADVLATLKVSAVQWDPTIPNTLYATTTQGVYAVRLP